MLYRRVACVAALVVGALLALAFRLSVTSWTSTQRYDRAESRPIVLDASGPEAASAPPSSPPAAHGLFVCAVMDDDTARPIDGATVLAVADRPGQHALGFRLTETVLTQALSDAQGTAILALPDAPPPTAVRAVARGFVPSEFTHEGTWPRGATILLRRGETLAGRVIDLRGRPVADLEVVATPTSLPRRASQLSMTGRGPRQWVTARADADGKFELEGLATGYYYLDAKGDGWRAVEPRPDPDPAQRIENDVIVPAGRDDVQLKVEAIRTFRVLLIDADTGAPIDDPYARITVQPTGGVRGAGPASAALRPGIWTGLAVLDDPASPPDTTIVRIFAVGSTPSTATVSLRRPSELAGDMADEIRLRPAGAFECIGSAVVTCLGPRNTPFFEYPCPRLHVRRDGKLLGFCQGCAVDPGTFSFARVPCGELEVRLDDGAMTTDWSALQVIRGETASASLQWKPPQGATIMLLDETGSEVFEADVCGVSGLAQGERAVDTLNVDRLYTEYHEAEGRQVRAVLPLEPGPYRCDIIKAGHNGSWTDFEVRPGEVTTVVVAVKDSDAR
jgi:hypothetical protein